MKSKLTSILLFAVAIFLNACKNDREQIPRGIHKFSKVLTYDYRDSIDQQNWLKPKAISPNGVFLSVINDSLVYRGTSKQENVYSWENPFVGVTTFDLPKYKDVPVKFGDFRLAGVFDGDQVFLVSLLYYSKRRNEVLHVERGIKSGKIYFVTLYANEMYQPFDDPNEDFDLANPKDNVLSIEDTRK